METGEGVTVAALLAGWRRDGKPRHAEPRAGR